MGSLYKLKEKILWEKPSGLCCLCGREAEDGFFDQEIWTIGPDCFVYCPECARAAGLWPE